MDKVSRKITFEEEADLYEKEALAEIKKQHFDGTEEMGEPYSTLQMGRRVVYRARQEIANRVEVVHARWECTYDDERGETDVICSHCKNTRTINGCYVTSTGESCYFEDNYCPNCGAEMVGVDNDTI